MIEKKGITRRNIGRTQGTGGKNDKDKKAKEENKNEKPQQEGQKLK